MPLKLVEDKEDRPDPVEFRIPASDTKGHSSRHWFRCIPTMARQVEQMIQARQFPYRTKGDLLRHALHRHMRWLASLEPVVSVSQQVDAILELLRDEEMNNDFRVLFDRLGQRISQYVSEKSQGEAVRLVLTIRSHINEMPEGFWRERYTEHLKKNYGDLLKKAPKCNLGEMDDEEG